MHHVYGHSGASGIECADDTAALGTLGLYFKPQRCHPFHHYFYASTKGPQEREKEE